MKRVLPKISRISVITIWAAVVTVGRSAYADSFTFSPIPASGNISGPAGTTLGWGYSITNQSSSDWLVTTDLTADPFLHGTPALLFNFPSIAPGQTVTESFNSTIPTGLYELTWDSNAPASFSNSGDFVLSAQWWTGNPTGNGVFIADAPDASDPYSATVGGSSAVPEPSSLLLVLAAFAPIAGWFSRRWCMDRRGAST